MSMTPRERLLAVLHGKMPDRVPCCPDISNMVPCRLTGKPFWMIYGLQDPPLWQAHIAALNHFDLDGGFELYGFGDIFDDGAPDPWEPRVVLRREDGSLGIRDFHTGTGQWSSQVWYCAKDNPGTGVKPEVLGLEPGPPSWWERLEGRRSWPRGREMWRSVRKTMGDRGVVGVWVGATTCMLDGPEDVYAFHEDPKPFFERAERMKAGAEAQIKRLAELGDERPDLIFCGGSGTLVWQSPAIFRELSLPVLAHVTAVAAKHGFPTQVHSCGPEAELVRMAAEETHLTVIDPLETAPMGDCNLADLKKRFGTRIVLKGNLHTTEVMLRGTPAQVMEASRRAIEDAAEGGRFILSTGDQCGRDTPDANIHAMREACERWGRY